MTRAQLAEFHRLYHGWARALDRPVDRRAWERDIERAWRNLPLMPSSAMRQFGRVDTFHKSVRELFRRHGIAWRDTASLGAGFPDALVCWGTMVLLLEIKSGRRGRVNTKPATAKRQQEFASEFPVREVSTLAEAEAVIAWLKAAPVVSYG